MMGTKIFEQIRVRPVARNASMYQISVDRRFPHPTQRCSSIGKGGLVSHRAAT